MATLLIPCTHAMKGTALPVKWPQANNTKEARQSHRGSDPKAHTGAMPTSDISQDAANMHTRNHNAFHSRKLHKASARIHRDPFTGAGPPETKQGIGPTHRVIPDASRMATLHQRLSKRNTAQGATWGVLFTAQSSQRAGKRCSP